MTGESSQRASKSAEKSSKNDTFPHSSRPQEKKRLSNHSSKNVQHVLQGLQQSNMSSEGTQKRPDLMVTNQQQSTSTIPGGRIPASQKQGDSLNDSTIPMRDAPKYNKVHVVLSDHSDPTGGGPTLISASQINLPPNEALRQRSQHSSRGGSRRGSRSGGSNFFQMQQEAAAKAPLYKGLSYSMQKQSPADKPRLMDRDLASSGKPKPKLDRSKSHYPPDRSGYGGSADEKTPENSVMTKEDPNFSAMRNHIRTQSKHGRRELNESPQPPSRYKSQMLSSERFERGPSSRNPVLMKGNSGTKRSHRETNQTPGFLKKQYGEQRSEIMKRDSGLGSAREQYQQKKQRTGVHSPKTSSQNLREGEDNKSKQSALTNNTVNENITIRVRKKKEAKEKMDEIRKKVQAEMTIGISQYIDLSIASVTPVTADEFQGFSKKQKRLYLLQSQLFGRDMLDRQIKKFYQIQQENDPATQDTELLKMQKDMIHHSVELEHEHNDEDQKMLMDELGETDVKKNTNFFNCLVIKKDNTWKSGFDMLMLIVSCYNIFGNAYYSAFGVEGGRAFIYFDQAVESLFLLDMIFCFCQEYLDEETYSVVTDIKTIAMHYMKRSFLFDLLAWLPVDLINLDDRLNSKIMYEDDPTRLARLLKLLRLPRLAQLLDVEKFKQLVKEYYNKQLERNLKKNNNESYPIMRALLIVQFYRIIQLVIIIFSFSYFLGIVWHIIVKDFEDWENVDNYDVFNGYKTFYTWESYKLQYADDEGNPPSNVSSLIKVWYFGITTLSTIGFGDFTPKSMIEKFIISFVMMLGVSVFSYIMGNFIEILMGYRSMEQNGDHRELSKWVALLTKFNEATPLSKELITEIEDFFEFYWQNNPLLAFKSENDLRFIQELPENTVQQIYIDYLFRDFLYKFKYFFRIRKNRQELTLMDNKFRVFLVRFLNCLEPRRYSESQGLLQDQYQEVFEVLFVVNGSVLVGYRLFNETFYAKFIKQYAIIGDFACLNNKVSEFLYQPHETIQGFAVKKEKFMQILEDSLGSYLVPKIKKTYVNRIRNNILQHREVQARKFQTRIDYVDLSAFGVGVDFDDHDHFKEGCEEIERRIKTYSSRYGPLITKLKTIDRMLNQFMYQLAALSHRYDERMLMIWNLQNYDNYQMELLLKIFDREIYNQRKNKPLKKISYINIRHESESQCSNKLSMTKSRALKDEDAKQQKRGTIRKDSFIDNMKKYIPEK